VEKLEEPLARETGGDSKYINIVDGETASHLSISILLMVKRQGT